MSGTNDHDMRRLHTNEMEVGITDVVQRHAMRHVVKPKAISQKKLDFEHARPRWMREMAAEALGVFFYVYPGIASQASFFFNDLSPVSRTPSLRAVPQQCIAWYYCVTACDAA